MALGLFDGVLPADGAPDGVSVPEVDAADVSGEVSDEPGEGVALWGAFTGVTWGVVPGWASPPPATAKLASAAHTVATPTPAAASSA
nr:hypothetical protein [Kibdelosporangium sp. MJ126-NF4]CTQ92150.1 hypothetical protein [Kibdelosporangium sp. MJ126-NF4]